MNTGEDSELAEATSMLDDDVARTILAATSVEPRSAADLDAVCDASLPTIYRRLEALEAAGFVRSSTQVDPGGDHYEAYVARFHRLQVELAEGSFRTEVTLLEDPADRFTRLFEEFG